MERNQSLINLEMMIEKHHYDICAFANHASVTPDLLQAAFDGLEELTNEELRDLSRFMGVPVGILTCQHVIYLKNRHYKHRKMLEEHNEKLQFVIRAASEGNRYGQRYCKNHNWNYEKGESMFLTMFMSGALVSYAEYWAATTTLDEYIDIILAEQRERKVRGRSAKSKGGDVACAN